ncbi:MAG: NAD-dependent DNA ligase LigA [Thermotogota bacterium]|nr:NAD-dependent DNA ligase LigA [Thermotogota bacterium]
MTQEEKRVKERIDYLRKEIEKHDYNYYIMASPKISDQEYDQLYKELERLEQEYPQFLSKDSPTQKVGSKVLKEFKQIEHSQPMLSLDNTYNEEDIYAFSERLKKNIDNPFKYCVELKIDGVSFAARYLNGKLDRGISRGNGVTGEDITEHLKQTKGLPRELNQEIDIEVRGEVYMPEDVFAHVNKVREEKGLEVFANPRNATAGTFRQLNTIEVRKRGIGSFTYSIVEPEKYGIKSQTQMLERLRTLGFTIENHHKSLESIGDVIDYWITWTEKRHELNFDIDGLVVKVDELNLQKELGSTSHSPRWAIAFKFPAEQKETTLESLTWSVGRTGVITPVAHLTPVNLAGTTVKNANLHNIDNIREKDIKINDKVIIEKAGEIIPQVVRVIKEKRTGSEQEIDPPEECPVCGGEVGKAKSDEVAIRCLNPVCPAKVKRALQTFSSREAMNIEGLGEKLIDQLVEREMVEDIADIYYIKEEQLISLERVGQKSAKNLMDEIEKSKQKQLHHLLTGLGIPNVGKKMAKEISATFNSLDKILKANVDDLKAIDGVGEEMARGIVRFFANDKIKIIIKKLKEANVGFYEEQEDLIGTSLNGLKFVITGELESLTRSEIKEKIESQGGKTTSAVSKKTDYLLCGENPGSKLDKAKRLNVKIINEQEFFNLLNR